MRAHLQYCNHTFDRTQFGVGITKFLPTRRWIDAMTHRASFCITATFFLPSRREPNRLCGSVTLGSVPNLRRQRPIIRVALDTPSFQPSSNSISEPTSPVGRLIFRLETLRQFSRPHTVIGTILAILSLHVVAWRTSWVGLSHAMYLFLVALVPALAMNVFIVGLNQIYDIPIDKVNKPHLPLPSGRLSLLDAYRIVLIALLIGVAFCWIPGSDLALRVVLVGSAVLGAIYSAPPFRLKRWPVAASSCILAVRGLLVNSCFYWHASRSMMLPTVLKFAVVFFVVFGIVIALLKDVPDIRGDRVYGIGTIAVRAGPHAVFRFCVTMLSAAFISGAVFFWRFGANRWHNYLATFLQFLIAVTILSKSGNVDPANEKQAYQYYMFTWRCFYLQYLLLPMAF